MSDKFKAVILNQSGKEFSREIKTLDKSFFKTGDVLVKVDYSGLNSQKWRYTCERVSSYTRS